MIQDKERQVRLQFLEEAQDYLNTIESGLLGLSAGKIERQRLDEVLRAAHSIKGGAAMMGFSTLSQVAHRLEDFFKVLKVGKVDAFDRDLEMLFLSSVDRLRQIVALNRQSPDIDAIWLESNVNPILDKLYDFLGDPQPEDEAALLSADAGEDMHAFLFETEVEACLERLESIVADPQQPCLYQELEIAAQELGGLGEMLDLQPFSSLCQSVLEHLEATPEQLPEIASTAIAEWRRSQAMVLIGQLNALPSQLELSGEPATAKVSTQDTELEFIEEQAALEALPDMEELAIESLESFLDSEELATESLESFLDSEEIQSEAIDLFSSLEREIPAVIAETATENLVKEIPKQSGAIEIPVPIFKPQPVVAEEIGTASENTIRVATKQIEQLGDLFGELTIERNGLDLKLKNLHNLLGILKQKVQLLEQSNFRLRSAYDRVATQAVPTVTLRQPVLANNSKQNLSQTFNNNNDRKGNLDLLNQFDLLEMDRYSDLHLVSQELIETVVQIQEVTTDLEINLDETEKNARELGRTSKLMQTTLTQVRMRPLSDLLGRFPRALRQMELQYGKEVELKIKGGSTLIDRSVLEALNDPLMHLLRNAFDHGIELPEVRRASGKPERGTIEIGAQYRGNQTIITISDDGAGINVNKIAAKAIGMGLDESDLAKAGEHALLDLIFEPGFSTAEQVTDLSGRGVGMDVVRTNLQQIRGQIQVDTKAGLGTTFTITIPFTLSVVRVLLVESAGMLLAFPTNVVEEMLLLQPETILSTAGQQILYLEGYMITFIELSKWLELPSFAGMADTEAVPIIDRPSVLIVDRGGALVGIQVDRFWGEQEVAIRQVEGSIPLPTGFSGCTILGDGRVVPLVDIFALLNWIDDRGALGTSQQKFSSLLNHLDMPISDEPGVIPRSIEKDMLMVVDDSITVRRFLAETLEKAGYRVEQAKDGQDALEKLQKGLPIKAVVCDIEMPRLDGYGFLAQVKSDPKCKHIPVMMLTSRSGEKHRRMAMNLGASDYFSKPFKEQELLQTLDRLISEHRTPNTVQT
jgi:chemosensory pili system protein ChpA (sensor histidine kinase/response regulator)